MLSIVGRAGVPQKGTEGLGCWLWFGGSSLLYARKFLRHQTTNAEQTAVGAHNRSPAAEQGIVGALIGGGLTRGRISLASGQHNRGLAEALQLDAAGRGIGRQHGGGSGYRRSIVFNRYLQKVLRIADAQDQRFHHQLSIHAERILHGGKQSLYGKLAAGANPERRSRFGGEARTRACLHESRLIRERGASARYLEIVSKQGLLRNSGQGCGNFLLVIGRRRANVEHVDLNFGLVGLRGFRRLVLSAHCQAQSKQASGYESPNSHSLNSHLHILSKPAPGPECTAGFRLIAAWVSVL